MATGQLAPSMLQPPRLRLRGVPVLLYHGLIDSPDVAVPPRERKYWLVRKQFSAHLNQIRQGDYQVVLLRELWNRPASPHRAEPSVALTFDDGLASNYHIAYPLLLEAGARADFCVNTATIGTKGFLSWRQIAEMQRMGMSFQSHSHDHIDLSRAPIHIMSRQVRESKQRLEDHLGCAVDFLAAPYGLLNSQVVEVALQEGYRAVCSSWAWPAQPGAQTLNRVAIYDHTTPREFQQLLARSSLCYATRAVRALLRYLPKQLYRCFRPPRPGMPVLGEPV